jgi:hypothetical protein
VRQQVLERYLQRKRLRSAADFGTKKREKNVKKTLKIVK